MLALVIVWYEEDNLLACGWISYAVLYIIHKIFPKNMDME